MTRWPSLVRIRARKPETLLLLRRVPPRVRFVIWLLQVYQFNRLQKATVYKYTTFVWLANGNDPGANITQ